RFEAVHVADSLMAIDTAPAFAHHVIVGLTIEILGARRARRQRKGLHAASRIGRRWNRDGRRRDRDLIGRWRDEHGGRFRGGDDRCLGTVRALRYGGGRNGGRCLFRSGLAKWEHSPNATRLGARSST